MASDPRFAGLLPGGPTGLALATNPDFIEKYGSEAGAIPAPDPIEEMGATLIDNGTTETTAPRPSMGSEALTGSLTPAPAPDPLRIPADANAVMYTARLYAQQVGLPWPYVDFAALNRTGRAYINTFALDPNILHNDRERFGIPPLMSYENIEQTLFSPNLGDQTRAATWAVAGMSSVYDTYKHLEGTDRAAIVAVLDGYDQVLPIVTGQYINVPLQAGMLVSFAHYMQQGQVYIPYVPTAQTLAESTPLPGVLGGLKETTRFIAGTVADGAGAVFDVVSEKAGAAIRETLTANPVITSIVTGVIVALIVRAVTRK